MRPVRLALLLCLFASLSCRGKVQPAAKESPTPVTRAAGPVKLVTGSDVPFLVELSEADPSLDGASGEARAAVVGEPLGEDDAAKLLQRLPKLEAEDDDRQAFAKRPDSQPPPRTGATEKVPFPPPPGPPPPDPTEEGPLSVVRFAPEGDVPLAPHLTVTFSQPMVPVTGQDANAAVVPVTVTPEPPGQWRWLGTKTVIFEPEPRFPMATEYVVEVPAGTPSETGGALDDRHTFSFRTPPLRLLQHSPTGGPTGLSPVIVLGFDQSIDRQALLPHLELKAGRLSMPVRLATAAEIAADPVAARQSAPPDRWIAVVPKQELPKDTSCTMTVQAGAPSAEGPRLTTTEQAFSFRTYGPLRITDHRCSWGDDCPPQAEWSVEFSNPLDTEAFDGGAWTVTPEVRALQVNAWGQRVGIRSVKKGRTTYTVRVPGAVRDVFGQTLGGDKELTFKVGPADQRMSGPGREFLVLDPAAEPSIPLYTVNHSIAKMRVFRAGAADWGPLSGWMRDRYRDNRGPLPLQKLATTTIQIEEVADDLVETSVDLSQWLEGEAGGVFVWIEPPNQPAKRWQRTDVFVWVQRTPLGLAAFTDRQELLGWATDLSTGASAEGVTLSIYDTQTGKESSAGTTGSDGTVVLPLPKQAQGSQLLLAKRGGAEVGFLPQNTGWWNRGPGWQYSEAQDELRWYVVDDRGLYKPGETASIKGFVRTLERARGGDVSGEGVPTRVNWTLRGPRWNELGSGSADVNAAGGFDFTVDLPPDMNLGDARVQINAVDGATRGWRTYDKVLKVQEFRRPEFEVKAQVDPGPYVLGEHAVFEVEAGYFAGGALPEAEVNWTTTTQASSYRPPGWEGWSFGVWTPWWRHWDGGFPGGNSWGDWKNLQGTTDGLGTHRLRVDFLAMSPPKPWSVKAEATVMDVNRQAWTARSTVLVHPAAAYPALKLGQSFVDEGEEVTVSVGLAAIEGEALGGRTVEVTFERLEWGYSGGRWQEEAKDATTCSAETTSSAETPATCSFTPAVGGSWRMTGSATDSEGRVATTELRLWVRGGTGKPDRNLTEQEIVLVPSAEEYAVGETAQVLAIAPFAPWEGLVTWQRQGRIHEERFTSAEATRVLEIPITEAMLPGLTVQVDAVGQADRLDAKGKPAPNKPKRPAFATGTVALKVPPLLRTLDVAITPAEPELEPGSDTRVDLVVTDASGAPIEGAELAVIVVDESVLALTGYELPDPLTTFYEARPAGVATTKLRRDVVLADLASLADAVEGGEAPVEESAPMDKMDGAMPPPAPSAPGAARSRSAGLMAESAAEPLMDGDMESDDAGFAANAMKEEAPNTGEGDPAVQLRTNFAALALFAPAVPTDEAGRASVELSLPDSLTRYRVMVVAADDARFGHGTASITARKPLMVRPSPPRFLNFGDRFELPIVVQNQTKEPMQVDVALRTANLPLRDAVFANGSAVRVTVPADDRVEVRFPASADEAGTARFQVLAASGDWSDAAEQELPVWTPATSEAFATYGVVDEGVIVQPVQAPGEVWPQFGGLEVTTSSTAVQALTDAVIYLTNYPYECAEQISSRVLGIAALRDVLTAFEAEELPAPEVLEATVKADLEKLERRQNPDGGFGFWRKGQPSWPWVSVHVAHTLARAEDKGYAVPDGMRKRALGYLRSIDSHIPSWYSKRSRDAVVAYAVFVRDLLGDTPTQRARRLWKEAGIDGLSMESLGLLMPVMQGIGDASTVETIERHLLNRVSETAAAAHFVEDYSDGAHVLMHSDRRTDGIILEALVRVRPGSDLIPKLVEGLLAHRTKGRWLNTQENVFILLALDRYFGAFEKTTPDFVARVWLGDDYAGDHAFRGRTTERARIDVPMAMLTEDGSQGDKKPLTIQKDGAGRMYYRVGMSYAPRSLDLDPADRGFVVERVYEPVDDEDDVVRGEDGTWTVKAGARVRVRLTMVATGRRVHVALVDPLPAGLEPVNPELATSGSAPPDESSSDDPSQARGYWWWWRPWYEHENLRDERVEAFTNLLWAGVHEYTYIARATTPGEFVVPPTKAHEMYNPETFGRTGTDRVVVE